MNKLGKLNETSNDLLEAWIRESIEKCYREGYYGLDDDCECGEPGVKSTD
ncbi:MAG: hypothetical protein ACP5PT_05315 [Brevinematia bacterium]